MSKRWRRHGQTVQVYETYCSRCKERQIVSLAEGTPPQPGCTPLCAQCHAVGIRSVLVFTPYRSGPPDTKV